MIDEDNMPSPRMKLPIKYSKSHWSVRKEAREQYVKDQDGLCHHCGYTLSEPAPKEITKVPLTAHLFPENFFNSPVHLHHSHETDLTIGAVHNYCNAILWEFYDE